MPKEKLARIWEALISEPKFYNSASPKKRRAMNIFFFIFGVLLLAAGGLLFFNCHCKFDAIMSGSSILAGAAILGCLYHEYQNARLSDTPTSQADDEADS